MKYLVAGLTALLMSVPAQAALHIYEFTAEVSSLANTRIKQYEQSSVGVRAGSVITLGDRIVGRFSYDSSAKPLRVDSSPYVSQVSYNYNAPVSPSNFFTFTILPSGQTVTTADSEIPWRRMTLVDDRAGRPYARDELSIGGAKNIDDDYGLRFIDTNAAWFSNGHLPQQLSLSDMTSASVHHDYVSAWGERILLSATMTSLTNISITPVPEPGTWAMLLAGLTILGVSARRQRA